MVQRVRASIKKSTIKRVERDGKAFRKASGAADSFVNYALNLGIGTDNPTSGSTYGFLPITRVRTLLEWVHRGSWLGGMAVDVVAEDMTREGIEITSTSDPEEIDKLSQAQIRYNVWGSLCEAEKWARLYGGSLAVIMIDGQDPAQPLRLETVGRDKFRGLLVLDRWQVDPDLQHLVTDLGPHLGEPESYRVVSDAPAFRNQRIHYTRCIRLIGVKLPYWQRIMENLWGLSVIERMYDRMVAFDSATTGAAQLVYKSYIRTYALDGYREAQAIGGDALAGVEAQVAQMRRYQGIEGITLIDGKDKFEGIANVSFSGLSDALVQFGQQIAGALQIPLVRLFGQSPAGLNSTGESDLRTYYDNIKKLQETDMREGVNKVLHCMARSEGIELKREFGFNFVPLWQMDEKEKSEIADRDAKSVMEMEAASLISEKTALQELRQGSKKTGRYTNITDEMIENADDVPAGPPLGGEEGEMGQEGAGPGEPAQPGQKPNGKMNGRSSGGEPEPGSLEGLERLKKLRKLIPQGTDRAHDHDFPYTEVAGLQVVIEQRRGTIRRGRGWSVVMPADYGYIRRVGSAEGPEEWLDCIVCNDLSSRLVWVIDAETPEGEFDEHKVVLGARTRRQATQTFQKMYPDGSRRIRSLTELDMDSLEFKNWLAGADFTEPAADVIEMAAE